MTIQLTGSFVRVPTSLLDALIRARLSGSQRLLALWVIRQTYGWNRLWTTFTWYRVAKELGMDRPTAYRSGKVLVNAKVLLVEGTRIAVQVDHTLWDPLVNRIDAPTQLWMSGMGIVGRQPKALAESNAADGWRQRNRWEQTTVSRRAKDNKDTLKTFIKIDKIGQAGQYPTKPSRSQQRALAGAARPIPGKYDRLS